MTTIKLNPAQQALIDEHLDAVDRVLAAEGTPLGERRRVTDDLELQIHDMLAERAGTNPTEGDVRAVLAELDTPEDYAEADAERGTNAGYAGSSAAGMAQPARHSRLAILAALWIPLVLLVVIPFYDMRHPQTIRIHTEPTSLHDQAEEKLRYVLQAALLKAPDGPFDLLKLKLISDMTAAEALVNYTGPPRPHEAESVVREGERMGGSLTVEELGGGRWHFHGDEGLRNIDFELKQTDTREPLKFFWNENTLLWLLVGLGALAPFGATILGVVAIGQIQRSGGRLYGMGLAVFDALFYPLLVLNALSIATCLGVLLLIVRIPPQTHAVRLTWLWISIIAVPLALWIAFTCNRRIVKRVWDNVNRPLGEDAAYSVLESERT